MTGVSASPHCGNRPSSAIVRLSFSDSSPLFALALAAVVCVLPLLLVLGSARGAALTIGAMGVACALLFLLLVGRGQVVDVLLLGFLALVFVPVDKYLGYQDHTGGWPGIRFAVADGALLLLLVPLALGVLVGRVRNRLPSWVLVTYALLLVQYIISALGAQHRDLAAYEIASALHALLIAGVVAALVRRRHVGAVVAVFAALVVLHSAFGIAQAITGRPIGASWMGGPETLMQEEMLTGSVRMRPAGLLTHPVIYATLFCLTLPVLAAGMLTARSRLAATLVGGALLIGGVGLALTLSRGAWISTVFAGGLLLVMGLRRGLLRRRAWRRVVILGLCLAVVAAPFAPVAWERLTASQPGNVDVRFELNEIALRMIKDRPFRGTGLNNFLQIFERYDPEDVAEYFPAAVHNVYLLEASEAGLPALILFVALIIGIPVAGVRATARVEDRRLAWIVLALSCALLGFALSQVTEFSHRLEPLRSIIWAEIGLIFGLLAEDYRTRSAREPSGPGGTAAPGA